MIRWLGFTRQKVADGKRRRIVGFGPLSVTGDKLTLFRGGRTSRVWQHSTPLSLHTYLVRANLISAADVNLRQTLAARTDRGYLSFWGQVAADDLTLPPVYASMREGIQFFGGSYPAHPQVLPVTPAPGGGYRVRIDGARLIVTSESATPITTPPFTGYINPGGMVVKVWRADTVTAGSVQARVIDAGYSSTTGNTHVYLDSTVSGMWSMGSKFSGFTNATKTLQIPGNVVHQIYTSSFPQELEIPVSGVSSGTVLNLAASNVDWDGYVESCIVQPRTLPSWSGPRTAHLRVTSGPYAGALLPVIVHDNGAYFESMRVPHPELGHGTVIRSEAIGYCSLNHSVKGTFEVKARLSGLKWDAERSCFYFRRTIKMPPTPQTVEGDNAIRGGGNLALGHFMPDALVKWTRQNHSQSTLPGALFLNTSAGWIAANRIPPGATLPKLDFVSSFPGVESLPDFLPVQTAYKVTQTRPYEWLIEARLDVQRNANHPASYDGPLIFDLTIQMPFERGCILDFPAVSGPATAAIPAAGPYLVLPYGSLSWLHCISGAGEIVTYRVTLQSGQGVIPGSYSVTVRDWMEADRIAMGSQVSFNPRSRTCWTNQPVVLLNGQATARNGNLQQPFNIKIGYRVKRASFCRVNPNTRFLGFGTMVGTSLTGRNLFAGVTQDELDQLTTPHGLKLTRINDHRANLVGVGSGPVSGRVAVLRLSSFGLGRSWITSSGNGDVVYWVEDSRQTGLLLYESPQDYYDPTPLAFGLRYQPSTNDVWRVVGYEPRAVRHRWQPRIYGSHTWKDNAQLVLSSVFTNWLIATLDRPADFYHAIRFCAACWDHEAPNGLSRILNPLWSSRDKAETPEDPWVAGAFGICDFVHDLAPSNVPISSLSRGVRWKLLGNSSIVVPGDYVTTNVSSPYITQGASRGKDGGIGSVRGTVRPGELTSATVEIHRGRTYTSLFWDPEKQEISGLDAHKWKLGDRLIIANTGLPLPATLDSLDTREIHAIFPKSNGKYRAFPGFGNLPLHFTGVVYNLPRARLRGYCHVHGSPWPSWDELYQEFTVTLEGWDVWHGFNINGSFTVRNQRSSSNVHASAGFRRIAQTTGDVQIFMNEVIGEYPSFRLPSWENNHSHNYVYYRQRWCWVIIRAGLTVPGQPRVQVEALFVDPLDGSFPIVCDVSHHEQGLYSPYINADGSFGSGAIGSVKITGAVKRAAYR